MASDTGTCKICSVFLGSSERTKVKEIAESLEALLAYTNFKLLEDFLICDTCLIKVQSACKFKVSYLENSQKLCIKQEDVENEAVCEICKESVNPVDCIPLFYSLTEGDKMNLFNFLSSELELKSYNSPQTCELCHKSILNFCIVIKSFSLIKNEISDDIIVSDLKSEKLSSDQDIIMDSVDSIGDCTVDIKKEDAEVKLEQGPANTYEDFVSKNEEIDLKTEEDLIGSYSREEEEVFNRLTCDYQHKNSNETEMFKCHTCDFQAKYKGSLKTHLIVHKNSNETVMFNCHICTYQSRYRGDLKKHLIVHKNEIFKCQTCDFQTSYKGNLKSHLIVHKNSNEIEMFKCHMCDYQTKFKNNFNRHLIVHKNSNETEVFKCQFCDFQTKHKRALKTHLIVHKSSDEIDMFKCHICNYQTKCKKYLKNHLIVHKSPAETEMFKCYTCYFQTKHKGNLIKHLIVHKSSNEIKMFKCHICDYQTKFKNNFNRHLIIHKN